MAGSLRTFGRCKGGMSVCALDKRGSDGDRPWPFCKVLSTISFIRWISLTPTIVLFLYFLASVRSAANDSLNNSHTFCHATADDYGDVKIGSFFIISFKTIDGFVAYCTCVDNPTINSY